MAADVHQYVFHICSFCLKIFLPAMASQAFDPDSQPSASYEEPATQLDPEVSVATQLDPEPEHEVDSVKKRKSEHLSRLEPDRLKWVGDLCFLCKEALMDSSTVAGTRCTCQAPSLDSNV